MPTAPKRPCNYAGCSELTDSTFCETHKKQVTQRRQQASDAKRLSSTDRGYGTRWRNTSKGRLRKHPLCVDPYGFHKDRVVAATLTDHIIPHKGNMVLFWDPSNWQSLCDSCHSYKTAKEDGGFGHQQKLLC
jgi:5-methylcytosine-specific restriction protein A